MVGPVVVADWGTAGLTGCACEKNRCGTKGYVHVLGLKKVLGQVRRRVVCRTASGKSGQSGLGPLRPRWSQWGQFGEEGRCHCWCFVGWMQVSVGTLLVRVVGKVGYGLWCPYAEMQWEAKSPARKVDPWNGATPVEVPPSNRVWVRTKVVCNRTGHNKF
jgi:hypothetical protein